jgi:tubulin--tyrosine ligase
VFPRLRELARLAFSAALPFIKQQKSQYEFELFGLDFMLDQDLRPYLIEVNSNPSLCTSCPLLEKVIGGALDRLLKLAVDPLFGPGKSKHPLPPRLDGLDLLLDEKDEGWL